MIKKIREKFLDNRKVDEKYQICCCRPEILHDESLKFQIKFKDNNEKLGKNSPYKDYKDGELTDHPSQNKDKAN